MEIIRQLADDVGADTALKLMGIFKTDVDTRVQAIRDYQTHGGDLQDLRIQAHSLKGLCRTYGAARGGDVAMELQAACDANDTSAIQAKTQEALDVIPSDVEATIAAATSLANG